MKIVFFGTPKFALSALNALAVSRHDVLAVVSQPDRALDRKGNLLSTPAAAEAKKLGLNLFQFASVKKEGIETLKKLNADIFITAAYGQLLSQEILDIPRFGVINVHASLLPIYRGSSPVHHAVLNGDKTTGVTIMQTRLALDSGEIILQASTDIMPDENTESLMDRLSEIGADLLLGALDKIEDGTAEYLPQDEKNVVFCGKITPLMSKIDWSKTATEINNLIRAVGGSAVVAGRAVKISKAAVFSGDFQDVFLNNKKTEDNSHKDDNISGKTPGEILPGRKLLVVCGKGVLEITALIPSGGKAMTGQDFLLGLKAREDARFE